MHAVRSDSASITDRASGTEERLCPLCRTVMREAYSDIRAEETGASFSVARCPGCGLGRTCPHDFDMAPYYGASYYGNRHGATSRLCVHRRLKLVKDRVGDVKGRTLLDFGCGDGAFLRATRSSGFESFGVERDPPAELREDLRVVSGLDELPSDARFDCVTLWHVLEHLDDPIGVLNTMRSKLKPDGVIVAAVPNFASLQSRVTGSSWLHLDIPRHLNHFTRASLVKVFESAGFQARDISYGEIEYDVIGWSQSLLTRVLGGQNEFFKAVSGRPGSRKTPRKFFHLPVGLALSILATFPAWGEPDRFGGHLDPDRSNPQEISIPRCTGTRESSLSCRRITPKRPSCRRTRRLTVGSWTT